MTAGVEVRVAGQKLDPSLEAALVELRVDDNLVLPDAFLIRLADPKLALVDASPLEIGAEVEILFAGAEDRSLKKLLEGQILALEPEFHADGAVLAVRGYDHSHALHRTRRTRTFQNMTAGDIARKVAAGSRVQLGMIESAGPVHDFVQQSNETDWEFLRRLAGRIDFEVLVADRKLHFRKAGSAHDAPISLRWGDNLLSFRPRVTGVQQVDDVVVRAWDPQAKQPIEARARTGDPDSTIGIARADVVSAVGGGTIAVGDRPVLTRDEADELAKSLAAHHANAYLEADGVCNGNPALRAGARVSVERIGRRYSGTYTVSSTSHVFRGARGYTTRFATSGRATRSLVDLTSAAAPRAWGTGVVVGEVTQNDDPAGLGRLRVRYPALGDEAEGWWARVASPGAGKDKGLHMTPVVGDEVLVAFEHGDVRRPYVLGALWNGKATPGDLVQKDGSFALQSEQRVRVAAKDAIAISGGDDLTIEVDGKLTEKAGGDGHIEASGKVTVKAGSSLTLEGASTITIKAGGASIELSGGTVRLKGTQIELG
jgi:phage protein D